jgi:deoxycytidylate deaminase
MDDDKKYVPGKHTVHHIALERVANPVPQSPFSELAPEDFNTPEQCLQNIADATGDPKLQAMAAAGMGAWVTGRSEVKLTGVRTPPPAAIHAACMAAVNSPCQKSQRGAVIFHPFTGWQSVGACNGRPDMKCDSLCYDPMSRTRPPPSVCAMMCLHAEQRAIRFAVDNAARSEFIADGEGAFSIMDCELVHAKVVMGELVASGPPSCIWCAKEIADVGLHGVWLYEERFGVDTWCFYSTNEFWEATIREVKIT